MSYLGKFVVWKVQLNEVGEVGQGVRVDRCDPTVKGDSWF